MKCPRANLMSLEAMQMFVSDPGPSGPLLFTFPPSQVTALHIYTALQRLRRQLRKYQVEISLNLGYVAHGALSKPGSAITGFIH